MQLKKLLTNLNLRTRINLYMGIFMLIIVVFAIASYKYQINEIIKNTHKEMVIEQSDMLSLLDVVENLTGDGFTEKDYKSIKSFFDNKKFFETGYPFLVTKGGDYIIHPTKEGKNQLNSKYHQQRLSYKNGQGYFKYIFAGDDSGRVKWQYFKYFKPYDAYITVSFFEEELFRELSKTRSIIIGGIIVLMLFFFFGIQATLNPIINSIIYIVNNLGDMVKGSIISKLHHKSNDEIGEIIKSINQLIEGNTNTAQFADEIGKGNLNAEYSPLSNEDVLGISLLEMRANLQKAKKEEANRKLEIEKQNWASVGSAKFAEILRDNNNDIEKLSFSIISNIVDYIKVDIGAIYVINNSNPDDVFYELTSAIAYDRQKTVEKKVRIGEGLVGRTIHEKLTIHMIDIPDSYIRITSGLGTANPNSLLLVPMIINEEVFGVIELASFKKFESYQIDFIEKLGENIASTLSTVKINQKTSTLLEESQMQKEQLAAQEEEMRQNLEELMATQEEMKRKIDEKDDVSDSDS